MIDTSQLAFPKPSAKQRKVTLSRHGRRKLLEDLCRQQRMRCCHCERTMTRESDLMNTATLSHRNPEPMGCKKQDSKENICGAACWKCNFERGSKRDNQAS